jgi:hypothetical protein
MKNISLEQIYPALSEEQRQRAGTNLARYAMLVLRVACRIATSTREDSLDENVSGSYDRIGTVDSPPQ